MRVFVAGGSGVVGRRLVPQLVARGHQVTATTTNAARLDSLERLGAEGVVMDGLEAACAGARRPMRVPAWLARPLAGDVAVVMMTEGRGFSNAKAKAELGWRLRHPSWRQGFREELA
ncbi:NAD(P)H-binding protein [Actinomadura viridis]|uniref:Nucleoside-diphosphate-sugar epimerase n=1 Tax=Actinomadura viridis TaxID=58110 RepID=A0A931DLH7_9ACTN|nr:NAD(P)H-binding protein [Actinomadura viridis]MBG6089756.1 nucleoside-diphosphate-sugar epimerase [Actinomadura viridis]